MTDPTPMSPPPEPELPPVSTLRFEPPAVLREKAERSQRLQLLIARLLFLVMLVVVTVLTVASQTDQNDPDQFGIGTVISLFAVSSAIGILVIIVDTRTPNKRLSLLVGVYLGVLAGLIGTLAVAQLLDVIATSWEVDKQSWGRYLGLIKVIIGIILCYLAVSVVLTTKDDFRLVIPYVEFAKQVRGVRPFVLDTSALIDGRIEKIAETGFLDAPLIVPQFVVYELQTLADSGDKLKRARGRRGLVQINRLQESAYADVTVDTLDVQGVSVDQMLVQTASEQGWRIVTTDYNLNKVARIRGVDVLNVNDLANALKSQAIPGEALSIEVIKRGEGAEQGVGYLPDGTMVVIEEAAGHIGRRVRAIVTNALTTTAGRMIFAKLGDDAHPDDDHDDHDDDTPGDRGHRGDDPTDRPPANEPSSRLADAATHQPRSTSRPAKPASADRRRNPRR